MSNTNHDFLVKNGLVVGQAITSTGTLTQAGQTFPASDGSAGQYLKTNGSGALSWGTVNTSFNITDGTTTDTVGSTETVTFTGGTNITLAVTDNTVTITNDVVDSDDITEGSSNLFYTDARAVAAIQGASNLTIDGGTLYVDTAADRVGISDTSPQQKLDVAGNIGINGSEVIDASGNIVGSVADSAMTVGGSLAGVLSNLKVQYGTSYSGTPIQGSFFFDSLNQKLKVYTGSAFIDAVPAGSGGGGGGGATDANTTFRNYSYTLTGTTSAVSGVDDNELTAGAFIVGHKYTITSVGNTDFTAIGASGNTVGVVFTATGVGSGTGQAKSTLFYDTTSSTTRVVAYVNGIKQVYGSGRDFVATTGTSVAFTYNLGSGDTVDIQVYELLTNDAYYLKSEVYTQTQVNSQISTGVSSYLPLAGGTMTGNIAKAGDFTLDVGGDLILDADGAQIRLKDNGVEFGVLSHETPNLVIKSQVSNGDIVFKANDGGSTITTMTIKGDGGNVGIGTTNPYGILHLHQNNSRLIFGSDTANLTAQQRIEFWEVAATATAADANFAIEYDGTSAYGGDGALLFRGSASSPISQQDYVFGGISRIGTAFFMNKFGIGNTDPQREVHIGAANNTNHDAIIILNNGGATGNRAGIEWRYEGITTPRARLSVNASTFELEADINGNKVAAFDPDGLKMTAGKGIKFSPYSSGNILDDYEEGSFTPNVYGESSAGSATYSYRDGWYRKIGDLVTAHLNIAFTRSGGSGRMLIGGLPYASNEESVGSFQANSCDGWPTATGQITSIIQHNDTYIHLRGTRNDGNGFHYIGFQPMSYCRISITYKTTS